MISKATTQAKLEYIIGSFNSVEQSIYVDADRGSDPKSNSG